MGEPGWDSWAFAGPEGLEFWRLAADRLKKCRALSRSVMVFARRSQSLHFGCPPEANWLLHYQLRLENHVLFAKPLVTSNWGILPCQRYSGTESCRQKRVFLGVGEIPVTTQRPWTHFLEKTCRHGPVQSGTNWPETNSWTSSNLYQVAVRRFFFSNVSMVCFQMVPFHFVTSLKSTWETYSAKNK